MLAKPESVAPSVVVSVVSHSCAWLSRTWRKFAAWNPSMSLDPRYVPGTVVAPGPPLPQIVFPGVPLDPPATAWTRTIRITNIRVNATAFAPANLLSQVVAIVQFQGPAAISVNQIQATIGFVAQGMGATKVTTDNAVVSTVTPAACGNWPVKKDCRDGVQTGELQ